MQIPIRTIVLGLLLALSATSVNAQPKAPEAALPAKVAATQQSTPIDLSLRPAATLRGNAAATLQSTPIDLALRPAATLPANATAPQQPTPIDLGLHAAAIPPSGPIDDLALQSASPEVKSVARWVIESRDNLGLPYLVIDKVNAQVFAFNAVGQLQGATPALLGMAQGDRLLAPNNAPMSAMPPHVRITPAGRFISRLAIDSHGKELLVLDYENAISLHAVVKGTPKERRAERLQSATTLDNRISYGCINVPAPFYSKIVSPTFTGTKGVVYVLPEKSPASDLFGVRPVGAAVSGAPQSSPALNAPRAAPTIAAPDAR